MNAWISTNTPLNAPLAGLPGGLQAVHVLVAIVVKDPAGNPTHNRRRYHRLLGKDYLKGSSKDVSAFASNFAV